MISFSSYIQGLQKALNSVDIQKLEEAITRILRVHEADGVIYVCGNGGSAATASHIVNDFVKAPAEASGCRPLRVIGLSDCIPLMTALANDISYERMFACQLEAYGRPGDLLIAISGSGNSPNILEAAKAARKQDMTIIAMTGFQGGTLGTLADIHINVNNSCFGQIEDAHLIIEHALVEMLKERLGGRSSAVT